MRDRGKREVEGNYNNGDEVDCFGESFPEFPCKKHPTSSSSSGGICAYCLTDRLYQLVCPKCGEQRLPNCSCTDQFSSNFNSSSTDHFMSSNNSNNSTVGRISFLLENDKGNNNNCEIPSSKPKAERKSSANMDDFVSLRRSNSTCVADLSYNTNTTTGRKETKDNKFWKIGKLFRKKREKSNNNNNNNNNSNQNQNTDQENSECNGFSRSRSMCSFRGFYDTEESGNFAVSSSAARASSVSTGNFYVDSAKRSCFSESEARFSNFDYYDTSGIMGNNNYTTGGSSNNKNIYSVREAEFMSCDDPAYIDLKLHDVSSSDNHHSKVPDLGALRRSGLGLSTREFGYNRGNEHVLGHEMYRNGAGSCRRSSVTERELRKCRKSYKVWKWFFRHQSDSANPDDQDHHNYQHHGFNS